MAGENGIIDTEHLLWYVKGMGDVIKKFSPMPIPGHFDAAMLLAEAKAAADPRDQHALLTRAAALSPQDLPVRRALLMLGRLYERDPRVVDFSVIPCYPLHVFEHPEKHDEAQQQRFARLLFDAPLLLDCLALAPDPLVFRKDYLQETSANYIEIFIRGDSSHAPRFFGLGKANLARPAADVIRNTFCSPFLDEAEQQLLAGAFYRAYHQAMGGQTQALDTLLGAQIGALLV